MSQPIKQIINAALLGLLINSVNAQTVSEPIEVVRSNEFSDDAADDYVPDGTLAIISQGVNERWLIPLWDRKHGGIKHLLTEGPVDYPLRSKIWIKSSAQFFENAKKQDGNLWIANTYIDKTGILAFVHAEAVEGSGKPGFPGRTRIGLAWSKNGGETFKYLGGIVTPFGDPAPYNVQGGAYIVKDGFFYIYYHDTRGITVARAPVDEVLSAARDGKTSVWKKYLGAELGFTSPGFGGDSYPIGVKGASHNDAACSTFNNECYLVLTMMTWGGIKSSIILYESADGIQWKQAKVIAVEPHTSGIRGYQYATIVDGDSSDNAIVGKQFYIYSAKNHLDADRGFYRWSVDLSK